MIKTFAFVLKREKLSDYNEKIYFFTKDFGKLSCHSFGSRSLKSVRNRLLNSFTVIKIFLKKEKSYYVLTNAEKTLTYNDLHEKKIFLLQEIIKIIDKVFPFQKNEPQVWNLTAYYFFVFPFVSVSDSGYFFYHFLFKYGFLKAVGHYPYFETCNNCGRKCSGNYVFDINSFGFIGENCLKTKNDLKKVKLNNPEKYPSTGFMNEYVDQTSLHYLQILYKRFKFTRSFFKKEYEYFEKSLLSGLKIKTLICLADQIIYQIVYK